MADKHRRDDPSDANGSPMASISQSQNSVLKRFLLQLQTMSLYNTIVPIAWLVAFITHIRALAGVGYTRNPLEETMKHDHLTTEDDFASPILDFP